MNVRNVHRARVEEPRGRPHYNYHDAVLGARTANIYIIHSGVYTPRRLYRACEAFLIKRLFITSFLNCLPRAPVPPPFSSSPAFARDLDSTIFQFLVIASAKSPARVPPSPTPRRKVEKARLVCVNCRATRDSSTFIFFN